jgi:integrase
MRFDRAFKKYLKNFDARGNVQTHNFRVSKATHMSEQKVPLQQIMQYLGHKSLNTT